MRKSIKIRQKVAFCLFACCLCFLLIISLFVSSCSEGSFVGKALKLPSKRWTDLPMEKAPEVFNTPFYQSPVRAEPDDLLNIPGYGFKMGAIAVYKKINDGQTNVPALAKIPLATSASEGKLEVVNYNGVPNFITVLLPSQMTGRQPYAIFVKNPNSKWSEPVLINDARPLWITPNSAYSTQQYASLPRELKVVGRNLESYIPRYGVHVKLVGEGTFIKAPTAYDLLAVNDGDPGTAIEHYVAKVKLPDYLLSGKYQVLVSRDGSNWITVPQQFEVLPDPVAKKRFDVSAYGCSPNDKMDDTGCIDTAIQDAKKVSGEVYLPEGEWLLADTTKISNPYLYAGGILVHPGVDLIGAGKDKTILKKTWSWVYHGANQDFVGTDLRSVFSLMGDNKVNGIHFVTEGYADNNEQLVSRMFLGLGKLPWTVKPEDPKVIKDVTIADCKFSQPFISIGTWSGDPMERIFIVNNELQSYYKSLSLEGVQPNNRPKEFVLRDSIISGNTFYPGDYVDIKSEQGTVASYLIGIDRVDFSNNMADGHVNGGFRAAYFFVLEDDSEKLLISQNKGFCTGDKAGDGEFIAFDGQEYADAAFNGGAAVLGSTSDSVTVNAQWLDPAKTYPKDLGKNYSKYWLWVVDGKGVGQVRRIVDYKIGQPSTIKVFPEWDVLPDQTSKLVSYNAFWNSYTVDNLVDIRGCLKNNPNKDAEGCINWYANVIDSTIEGNQQYDSRGILVWAIAKDIVAQFKYSGEIRNNLVEGEDIFPLSHSGIELRGGGIPANTLKPVIQYNIAVSHNKVVRADTYIHEYFNDPYFSQIPEDHRFKNPNGGGIALLNVGALSSQNSKVDGILVYHNSLKDIPTSGIHIHDSDIRNTVLYKNSFDSVGKDVVDGGKNTVSVK